MRYAIVNGEKRLPERGVWGECPFCGETVISKCGPQVVHHWAHKADAECDTWSEPVGPWHLEWQENVNPEFVEVTISPHRADIVGANDCVIELQHSPIPIAQIADRERFYGNMVWVFDATKRFEMITVGERVFFAFRGTRHVLSCSKPVFLDFGSMMVEVEEFTSAMPKIDGFGRKRSREWFADQFLAGRLRPNMKPRSHKPDLPYRWSKDRRFQRTIHPSRWQDPQANRVFTIPKGAVCIPLSWTYAIAGEPPVREWEKVVDEHDQLANGWTKQELTTMKDFLAGDVLILDGWLRVCLAQLGSLTST